MTHRRRLLVFLALSVTIWLVVWVLARFMFVVRDEMIIVAIGFAALWTWLYEQSGKSK